MGFTTFANSLSVAGKATDHWAVNTTPDECWLADMKTKQGFTNEAPSKNLGTGKTTMTMLCTLPIWVVRAKLDDGASRPAHAGVGKGVKVVGAYCSWAKATSGSPNVYAEGDHVVRLTDPTINNEGNCDGIVQDGPGGGATSAADDGDTGDDGADPDGKKKKPDTDDGPKAPESDDDGAGDDPAGDEGGEDEETECKVDSTMIECGHGRKPSGADLEVLRGDEIKFESKPDAVSCPDDAHPLWTMSGGEPAEFVGTKGSISVPGGADLGPSNVSGLAAASALATLAVIPPTKHTLKVEAHVGNDEYQIEAYPAMKIESGNMIPDKVREALETLQQGLNFFKDDIGKWEVTLKFLNGSVAIKGGWEEYTDHRCFFGFNLEIGFKPLIGISGKFAFPWGPYEWLHQLLDWLGIRIDLYVELSWFTDLVGTVGRQAPGPIPGVKIEGTHAISASLGAEIIIGEDSMGAEAKGTTTLGCPVSVQCAQLFSADTKLCLGPLDFGPVTMEATIWAAGFCARKLIRGAGGHEGYDISKGKKIATLGVKGTLFDKKSLSGTIEGTIIKAG